MSYTRQQERDQLRLNELKIDPNGRVWSDSILNTNLETARRKIQEDGHHDWFFNDGEDTSIVSVVSQQEYDLPTDFVRLELIKYDTWELLPTTKKYLKAHNSSLAVDGTPQYYYLLGSKFGVFQRPNANGKVFDLTYRKKLASFTSDASVEVMPDEFIEAIVQYAAYLSWSDIQGREDKAIQSMQNYKEIMEGLYSQYLEGRDDADLSFKFETINA